MNTKPLIFLTLLTSAAFAQKVTFEYDAAGHFNDFKTFAIVGGTLHSNNPSLNNPLVKKKIEAEIRADLTAKGLTEVTTQPDLNVRYSLGSGRRTEVDQYPAGWRGWGTRTVRTNYTEGTLVVDLNDARQHAMVWRGIAVEDKSDPMKIQDHLTDMVRKSFDKYPPKPK